MSCPLQTLLSCDVKSICIVLCVYLLYTYNRSLWNDLTPDNPHLYLRLLLKLDNLSIFLLESWCDFVLYVYNGAQNLRHFLNSYFECNSVHPRSQRVFVSIKWIQIATRSNRELKIQAKPNFWFLSGNRRSDALIILHNLFNKYCLRV